MYFYHWPPQTFRDITEEEILEAYAGLVHWRKKEAEASK